MKKVLFLGNSFKITFLILLLLATQNSAQTMLEMFSGSGNPTANGPITNTVITMQTASNTPYVPNLTATYNINI